MQNRIKPQQLILFKPDIKRNNKRIPSLTTLAFSKFAESKQGFFTPSEPEHYILDAIKRSNNELAINIKSLLEMPGFYAAWGMQEEAEELLAKLQPAQLNTALTTIVTIKDYAGRKHTGTAFELALKMGDVTYDEKYEWMTEMLARHMRNLENGQDIIKAQFENVFGKDLDAHIAKQQQNVYSLDAVIKAIDEATNEQLEAQLLHQDNSSTLNQTIAVFRKQFAEHSLKEEIFNPYHDYKAMKVYDDKHNVWNWLQLDVFWRQIIGGMQRFWPRCWLQAAISGLCGLSEKNYLTPFHRRMVELENNMTNEWILLDELDNDPKSRLGYDFAIYSGRVAGVAHVEKRRWCPRPSTYFTNFISMKNQSLQRLYVAQIPEQKTSHLGV